MPDVVADPDVFYESKIHATIIQKVIAKMKDDPYRDRPSHPNRKWVDTVELDVRYVVTLRNEDDRDVIIAIRRAKYSKKR